MRVGIVAQRGNARAAYLAADIRTALEPDRATVVVDPETAAALDDESPGVEEFSDCDLVVSIGGDGTFIHAARVAGTAPVLGVNLGEVGFLNAVAPDDAIDVVRREVRRYHEEGAVRSRDVPRLRAGGDGTGVLPPALNEIAILGRQRGRGGGLAVEIRVDGDLFASSHADGVLVATPTGSTAYNLSEDGPLVRPGLDAMVVTGMCPDQPLPSMVVDPDATVTVRMEDAPHAVVASDGSRQTEVEVPGQVTVTAADEPGRVAGPGVDFFRALAKLEWNGTD